MGGRGGGEGKVEYWECEGAGGEGSMCEAMYFSNPKD